MNSENFETLKETLRFLGFGALVFFPEKLEKMVTSEVIMFDITGDATIEENQPFEVTLFFRRLANSDTYYFEKFRAHLAAGKFSEMERTQTFFIRRRSGVTLRESYNLLLGRSVNKDWTTPDGDRYNAWIQLDFNEKESDGNYKVCQFRQQYGYNLEKLLQTLPIKELKNEELKLNLLKSLKKGNQHIVTFERFRKTEIRFIEACPARKCIVISNPSYKSEKYTSKAT